MLELQPGQMVHSSVIVAAFVVALLGLVKKLSTWSCAHAQKPDIPEKPVEVEVVWIEESVTYAYPISIRSSL